MRAVVLGRLWLPKQSEPVDDLDWILDPDERRLECFTLRDSAYEAAASTESPATLDLANWPGLTIDLGAIWR